MTMHKALHPSYDVDQLDIKKKKKKKEEDLSAFKIASLHQYND